MADLDIKLNADEMRQALYLALNNVISDARRLRREHGGVLSSAEDDALCVLLLKGLRSERARTARSMGL